MNNPRITKKEQGLLKGAIRRVFSRSELRRRVVDAHRIEHEDPKRPRVKKWSWCTECGEVTAAYELQIDHTIPVIPLDSSFEQMSIDEVVNRLWCEENNLKPLCPNCHNRKSKGENAARRLNKKEEGKK